MKPTRDPVTGQAAIELADNLIILKKGTTLEEAMQKPISDVVECSLGPQEY